MEESHKSKSLMMITKPLTTSKHEFCNHLVEISKIIIPRIFTISYFFLIEIVIQIQLLFFTRIIMHLYNYHKDKLDSSNLN